MISNKKIKLKSIILIQLDLFLITVQKKIKINQQKDMQHIQIQKVDQIQTII